MNPPVVRDYQSVIARVMALPARDWQVETAGTVAGLPFFAVRRQVVPSDRTILLMGGMHGDEPAGVEAALQWMEGDAWHRWRMNWLVLPCVNPFGWTHDRRANATGQDINRQFRDSGRCEEADLVKQTLGHQRFLLAMDFHEDSDSPGYYVCETKSGPPFLGGRIVTHLRSTLPIDESPRLDGRRANGPGWVLRLARHGAFARRRQWPLAFHLADCCTDHFLCNETPMRLPLPERVAAHLAALHEALQFAQEHTASRTIDTALERCETPLHEI